MICGPPGFRRPVVSPFETPIVDDQQGVVRHGKTKHGWITGAHMFSKKRIFTAKNQAILRLCPACFWRYALSNSVLLNSGGTRIRIKQIHFMHVVQLFIPASSVHIHFDRRSNTLQRGHEAT